MKQKLLILLICSLIFYCGVKTDSKIMKAIYMVVENCQIEVRYASIKNCKNKEKKKFISIARNKGLLASLNTLSKTLNDSDEKVQSASTGLLYIFRRELDSLADTTHLLKPKMIDNIFQGFEKLHNYGAFYMAEVAMKLASLTGREEEFLKIIEKHKVEAARNQAYRFLMVYGRLKNFNRVKQLALVGNKKFTRAAALAAPEYMSNYDDNEKKLICPWAVEFLNDSESGVAGGAARILLQRCGEGYVDKVLEKGVTLRRVDLLKNSGVWFAIHAIEYKCRAVFRQQLISKKQCKKIQLLSKSLK